MKGPEIPPQGPSSPEPKEGSGHLILGVQEPCPSCRVPGPAISRRAMLDHLQPEGIAMAHSWTQAFACLTPSCDCLYYSLWRLVPIRYCNKSLGYKTNSLPPRILCYCLGLTLEDIRRDLSGKKKGSNLERIREQASRNSLLCERMNPSGQCCWGQVRKSLDEGTQSPSRI